MLKVLQPIEHNQQALAVGAIVPAELFTAEQLAALLDCAALEQLVSATSQGAVLHAPISSPTDDNNVPPGTKRDTSAGVVDDATPLSPPPVPIALNTASESELLGLPHVGPLTAAKILAQRPFDSLEEARVAAGLSAGRWAEIAALIEL